MEKIKNNINKIIAILVLVFMATFGYNYVKEKEAGDLSEVIIGSESQQAREILETLNELENINIDYEFFYNKSKQKKGEVIFVVEGKEYLLKDFSRGELELKDFGKNNPFLEQNIEKKKVIKKPETQTEI